MENEANTKSHFENIAEDYDFWKNKNRYYYFLIKQFYAKSIPPGSSVIEFGCATGDILSSCSPKRGAGIDLSEKLIKLAQNKHPYYGFKVADIEDFSSSEKFDYVIMCDLLEHLSNIPRAIENAYAVLNLKGKLIINSLNPSWNPFLFLLEKMKLKMPEGPHCFIPNRVIEFLCRMKGFKIISKGALVFIPVKIPFFSELLNKAVPKFPILNRFCWVQTLIAQKDECAVKELSYSIIIPAHNEENNIEKCIKRIPKLRRDCEIVVVDDGSRDNTLLIAERLQKEMPNPKIIKLAKNKGKSSAVEKGIEHASKDVIVILDADMSVAPEDIPLFIEAIEKGLARFINGTRFIYNMENEAMPGIKKIGNFLFARMLSLITKCHLSDSLCGTKAFFRKDFTGVKLSEERWGDFVLLWEAKKKNLSIGEIPVRYYPRNSGQSKMRFFFDGILFMKYILKITIRDFFKTAIIKFRKIIP